jgi:hypothetical protein
VCVWGGGEGGRVQQGEGVEAGGVMITRWTNAAVRHRLPQQSAGREHTFMK